jgi:hypothetical protein
MSAETTAVAPSGIHVILGDCAGGTFRSAFKVRDGLLVDQDVLSCGPTPRCNDLATWRDLRGKFWSNWVPDLIEQHTPSSSNLVDNSACLREAERIVIWAATGVSEQLFVAFVCHLTRLTQTDPERVCLIQFEHLPNRRALVRGMGELDEDKLRRYPEPRLLTLEPFNDYLDAWHALTSPDPCDIERFAARHPAASSWLKEALRLMLRRFPDQHTGVTYWDWKLLENVQRHGPTAVRVIGHAMAENWEDGDLVGDWYLFGRLLRMANQQLPKPLLTCAGDRSNMREVKVALTPFGESVLARRESNHAANPIEESVAGVHLSSAASALWFADGDRLVRT